MIIGLAGYARSGKDTAFNIIKELYPNAKRFAFADPIKQMCASATGKTVEYIEENKEDIDPLFGVSYRVMLQTLGTEWARNLNKDWWILRMKRELSMYDCDENIAVITDVRFLNEAEFINSVGGKIIKIVRPSQNTIKENLHQSELEIYLIRPYYKVINNGIDMGAYIRNINLAMRDLMNA